MPLPGLDSSGNYTELAGTGATEGLAAAGSVIGNAATIGNVGLSVVTGADDTKGVVLPAAARGRRIYVYSDTATSGLKVYPPVNSTINGGSANSSVVIEGKTLALFLGTNSTNWAAIYTVNT